LPTANLWLSRSESDGDGDRAADEASSTFRVLVATGAREVAAPVNQWAARGGHLAQWARSSAEALRLARQSRPEVFLVDLLLGESEGVALAIDLLKESPGAEVVFLVEGLDMPEVRAARDVGMSRFVPTAELACYLSVAALPLARLARARRTLDDAQRDVARLPASGESRGSPLPLAVAERRYRESYLRATLAKGGGRREAARLTGVPYTTFCVMLRKLGITPDP
jgi:DNA-binding NtrC family response regulator